jgi:hypothetical protein
VVSARVWQPELGINSSAALLLRANADPHSSGAPVWRLQLLLATAAAESSNAFTISRLLLPPVPAAAVALREVRAGVHALRAEAGDWWSELELRASPFRLRLFVGRAGSTTPVGPAALVFNGHGLLRFAASEAATGGPAAAAAAAFASGSRARTPDGFVDSAPNGCTAVAADVTFPEALEAFGLPERAAPLALRPTLRTVSHAHKS